jgi:hypothetical protein
VALGTPFKPAPSQELSLKAMAQCRGKVITPNWSFELLGHRQIQISQRT